MKDIMTAIRLVLELLKQDRTKSHQYTTTKTTEIIADRQKNNTIVIKLIAR